eukprot:1802591-Pyramimonas_sp.AAC.1
MIAADAAAVVAATVQGHGQLVFLMAPFVGRVPFCASPVGSDAADLLGAEALLILKTRCEAVRGPAVDGDAACDDHRGVFPLKSYIDVCSAWSTLISLGEGLARVSSELQQAAAAVRPGGSKTELLGLS